MPSFIRLQETITSDSATKPSVKTENAKATKPVTTSIYYLHEREYGSFERSLALPDGVDADAIEATFKNGVLKVTLHKTVEARKLAKTIEVKAA